MSMDKSGEEFDPWALVTPKETGIPWHEKTVLQKIVAILKMLLAVCLLIAFLYLFICSLDFLSSAFRLLGGKTAGQAFRENDILSNPIADLMMGVLATVLLQSSSTTTSIVVAMVGSGIMPIRPAIFVIMGANIGTSVTNTIVSMGQAVNRNEFRRAFAGATVHDMFNCLSVIILLPIEWLSGAFGAWKDCGIICQLTSKIVEPLNSVDYEKQELLKVITKPFTDVIIRIDKKVVTRIATWNSSLGEMPDESLMKRCSEVVRGDPYVVSGDCTIDFNSSNIVVSPNDTTMTVNSLPCILGFTEAKKTVDCGYMFEGVADSWSDTEIGIAVLIFALMILIICLVAIVKILHFLLQGKIAIVLKKFVNLGVGSNVLLKELTGYLAIVIGAGLTMLVQSSSIFTSAITPLVGVGVLHIDRMYPLTLGANIGTTITAILASLAISGEGFQNSLQIALCHLFFNIFGIMIWYPVPVMRTVPIGMAKILGNTTAKFRWFAMFYLLLVFFIIPAAIFALSLAGWVALLGVGGPLFLFFIIIVTVNVFQTKCPGAMPVGCRDWSCCPGFLHSFRPYDNLCTICCQYKNSEEEHNMTVLSAGGDNGDVEKGGANGHVVSGGGDSGDVEKGGANGHVDSGEVNLGYGD